MRWFKHLSSANRDEKLSQIRDRFGLEGYGLYWLILEIIAEKVDEKNQTSVSFSPKTWRSFTQISPKKFQNFLSFCQKLEIFQVKISENLITVDCPNILKYRDEWTRRKAKNSGVTPEQLRTKEADIEVDIDKEIEKEVVVADSKVVANKQIRETPTAPSLTPQAATPTSSPNFVPFKKIQTLWNQALKEQGSIMEPITTILPNSYRGQNVIARWKEFPDLKIWQKVFVKAAKSAFLNEKGRSLFKGSFDWLVKSSDHFIRALEGNYDERYADPDDVEYSNDKPIKWKDLVEFNDANPEAVARNIKGGNMDESTVPPQILAEAKRLLTEEVKNQTAQDGNIPENQQNVQNEIAARSSDSQQSNQQKYQVTTKNYCKYQTENKESNHQTETYKAEQHRPIDLMAELTTPFCKEKRRQLKETYGPWINQQKRRYVC